MVGLVIRALKIKAVRTAIYVVLAAGVGAHLYGYLAPPKTVERVVDNVKTVYVDRPVLTEKIITNIIADPADKRAIRELLAQNELLKLNVTGLTQVIAELKATGGGPGTVVTDPTGVLAFSFHDFRVDFAVTGLQQTPTMNYELHQKFKVFVTSGRGKDGKPLNLASVSEVTPSGLVPLTIEVTNVFADQTSNHWLISGRIQAGFGVLFPAVDKGGVIAFQWLKRGRSESAEDVGFAVLSPAVFVGKTVGYGVLPVSVNLGRLPRQPFRDVWVSPFFSRTRAGVVLTATF